MDTFIGKSGSGIGCLDDIVAGLTRSPRANWLENNAGLFYGGSMGSPKDDAEAIKWYRKAADQGNAAAQYAVGSAYFSGRGVPQDFDLAHMWLNLAAAQAIDIGGQPGRSWIELRDTVSARLTPAPGG
jgi:hypothetical protein